MSDSGIRLSKRVMALAGCSRAEAERLIAQGDVQVDSVVQRDPAHRVADDQPVQVRSGAQPQGSSALTLLWHKPPGNDTPPPEARGLRCATPLDAAASGLVVFTGHVAVWRVLAQAEPPLEHEWLIDLPGAQPATVLGQGVRASVGSQNDQQTRLRAVVRGAWQVPADLAPLRRHRQRIGRVALGPLPAGATRALLPHEKF